MVVFGGDSQTGTNDHPVVVAVSSVLSDALIPALHSKHQKSSMSRIVPETCTLHYVEILATDLDNCMPAVRIVYLPCS